MDIHGEERSFEDLLDLKMWIISYFESPIGCTQYNLQSQQLYSILGGNHKNI